MPLPGADDKQPIEHGHGRRIGWIIAAVQSIAIAAAWLAYVIAAGNDAQSAAVRACEDVMRKEVVNPATARFSDVRWFDDLNGDGRSKVSGNIDSQNQLGAVVRATFTCQVDNPPHGDLSVVSGEITGPGGTLTGK